MTYSNPINATSVKSENYWILSPQHPKHAPVKPVEIKIDNDHIYVVGLDQGPTQKFGIVHKISKNGGLIWDKKIRKTFVSGQDHISYGVAVDSSSGDVYVCGRTEPNTIFQQGYIVKYNSSGDLQWQKTYGDPVGSDVNFRCIEVDGNGDVYAAGLFVSSSNTSFEPTIVKFDSDGNVQWKYIYSITGALRGCEPLSMAIDSGNNVYICGSRTETGPTEIAPIIKVNSSGSIQWDRGINTLGIGNSSVKLNSLAIDSSDNVYVVGEIRGAGSTDPGDAYIAKCNSSGDFLWQRNLINSTNTGFTESAEGVAVDGSDVYVCGFFSLSTTRSDPTQIFIAKYNSSGTFQWGRSIQYIGTTFDIKATSIKVDSNSIYVTAEQTVYDELRCMILKLPKDGNFTGAYPGPNSYS
jgi:hypothetical protein